MSGVKLKLLHVVPTYYPALQYGGTIAVTHQINKELVKQGVDVTVFTTMDGQDQSVKQNTVHIVDGVKVIYFKSYCETGYGISWLFPWYLAKKIKQFDIIHLVSVFTFTSLFTPLLCLIARKPYIIASHGTLDPQMIILKSGFRKKVAFYFYERFFLNHADAIHVLVEDEAVWLKELGVSNTRIVKIPNGLECAGFDLIKQEKSFTHVNLLYLGRLNYKKNIDLILRAYAKLKSKHDNLKLVIAGSDDGSEAGLKQLSKELNIGQDVSFSGFVKGIDKERLLEQCNIFLLPSKNEGLSIAQLEAMLAKCVVIVGCRGGIHHELVRFHAGKVIEPNVENLIHAIDLLVNDTEQMVQIGENAHALVIEKYNSEEILNRYIELYERLRTSRKN